MIKKYVGNDFIIMLEHKYNKQAWTFNVYYKSRHIAVGLIGINPWETYTITMSIKNSYGLTKFSIKYRGSVYREVRSQILNKILN